MRWLRFKHIFNTNSLRFTFKNVAVLIVFCNCPINCELWIKIIEDYLIIPTPKTSSWLIPLLVGDSGVCRWCPIADITSPGPVGSYRTGPPSPILIEIWLYATATRWPPTRPSCLSTAQKPVLLRHPATCLRAGPWEPCCCCCCCCSHFQFCLQELCRLLR